MADDDKQDTKLWDKLLASIESVIDLRIVTYVGDVEISGDLERPKIVFPTSPDAKALATSINLAQGDISSSIPEEYLTPDHEIIRDYHKMQMGLANEIVERNIGLLVDLVKNLAGELRGVPAREAEREDAGEAKDSPEPPKQTTSDAAP